MARRHAVFVDNRYWVLLDEIQTSDPQTAELRFHTYCKVRELAPRHWVFEQGEAAMDVVTSQSGVSGTIEFPSGWTKPVSVLSLKVAPASEQAVITVLEARARQAAPLGEVRTEQAANDLTVIVGADRIMFHRDANGWRVGQARIGK